MFLCAIASAIFSLAATQVPIPHQTLPFQEITDFTLRAELVRTMKALAASDFEAAAQHAARVPLNELRYSIVANEAPAAERTAIESALEAGMKAWETALGGVLKLEKVPDAGSIGPSSAPSRPHIRLVVKKGYSLFIQTGSPYMPVSGIGGQDLAWYTGPDGPRQVQALIYTDAGPEGTPHSLAQYTHLAARTLGCYFGLRPTAGVLGVMGLPTMGLPRTAPTPQEAATVKKIIEDYLQLLASVREKKTVEFSAPVIKVENTKVNFGRVSAEQPKTGEVHFSNEGNLPLQISVTADCSCVTKEYDANVAPGQKGKISFTLDSTRYSGRITRTLGINSNDPETPYVRIDVEAIVERDVATFPPGGTSLDLLLDQDTVHEFFVYSPTGKQFEIKQVSCQPERYQTTFEKGRRRFSAPDYPDIGEKEHDGYIVRVTIPVTEGHGGFMQGRVTVETTLSSPPVLTYSLRLSKGIQVTPGVVHMSVKDGQSDRRVVQLEQKGAAFKILNIEVSSDEIEVKQETLDDGHRYRLWLSPKQNLTKGLRAVRVLVTTDSPKQAKIPLTVWLNVEDSGAGS